MKFVFHYPQISPPLPRKSFIGTQLYSYIFSIGAFMLQRWSRVVSYDSDLMASKCNYLLCVPLHKMFADPWSRLSWWRQVPHLLCSLLCSLCLADTWYIWTNEQIHGWMWMNSYLNNSDAFKFNTNTFLKDKYFRRFLTEFSAAIVSGLSVTAVHLICEAGELVEVSVNRLR